MNVVSWNPHHSMQFSSGSSDRKIVFWDIDRLNMNSKEKTGNEMLVLKMLWSSFTQGIEAKWQIYHGVLKSNFSHRLSRTTLYKCGGWTKGYHRYDNGGICSYDVMKIIIKITSRVGAIDWWKTSRFCVKECYIEGLYWFRHAYIICLELLIFTHISLLLFPLPCLLLPIAYVLRFSYFWIVLFSWR